MLWTRSFNLKVNAARQYAVLDPDLEIRGGGGLQKNVFWPFGPQYGLRMGGGVSLAPSPVSTTDTENTV